MQHTAIHPPMLDLRQPEGAAALVRAWQRLAEVATLPTQDPAFVFAVAGAMLPHAPLTLFQSEREGRIAAALPLCRGRGPFARWRVPGAAEVFEPGDALCRDGDAAADLAQLLAAQRRPLELARVPAASPLVPALRQAMRGRGSISVRPAQACPVISLDSSWVEPEKRFSARRRSDFRRSARRAAALGEVRYETLSPAPDAFDAVFDEAIAVEANSWKRSAGTAIACDPTKEAFFRRYLRGACERGELRAAFLRIDGRVAAMQLALEWAGRCWLYKIGYDEAYARCSPGTLLMLHAIGDAARRGLTGFELMGETEAWIAELWTREAHRCVRVRTYPRSAAGAAAAACDGTAWLASRLRRPR